MKGVKHGNEQEKEFFVKVYLFLYPIQKFLEEDCDVSSFSDIIDSRYRQKGYQIQWLLFSSSRETPQKPDFSQLSQHLPVEGGDAILACGVTFQDLVQFERCPDPEFVLKQLPPHIEHLVLGGFHQWGCDERIAKAAQRRGIEVIVDQDAIPPFAQNASHLRSSAPRA